MSWWGNSFEKAVGFSNIATNALKQAQKKIDKVLDIPIDDDIAKSEGKKSPTEILSEIDVGNIGVDNDSNLSKDENVFSDTDLTSHKNQLTNIQTANIEKMNDQTELMCQRLGDWSIEDSLTASQFETYGHQLSDQSAATLLDTSDFMMGPETRLPIVCDYMEERNLGMSSHRESHLSIASDCTTSTMKKNTSDIDSSSHTDDLAFANNEMSFDASFNEDNVDDNEDHMLASFKRASNNSLEKEDTVTTPMKENSPTESQKHNLQFNQQLTIICTSKDDVDSNTTSSDIELVSCATSNNGDNQLQSSTHPGLRFFIPDHMKHYRSASGSSMSICKIDNGDYPSDPDNLSNQLAHYQRELDDLSHRLDIRESKIIQLSRENIDLKDTINNLSRQIEQVNERQETDATDINALTREFTTRLSEAEKRYQMANKERDQLKKQVVELERTESQQIEKVIKEKEDEVASLLQEGEKLAQNQLKANTGIKKLRNCVKEKESENLLLSQKISKLESEVTHLKKVLDNKNDNERKHIEGISQLTKAVEKMEKENLQCSTLNQMLQERNRSLDTALDRTAHELSNYKKQALQIESEKNAIQKDYQILIDQQSNKIEVFSDIKSKAEDNEKEVCLLQKRLQIQARESNCKDEEYNSRILYLQERLAEMEQRNDELNEATSVATRPIIRQLEAIQNVCATHTSNWEHIENSLNTKIHDLQQKLSLSEEAAMTYKEQLQSRDIQSNSVREEKNRILNQYNQEYSLRQLLVDEKMVIENQLSQTIHDTKKEKETFLRRIKDLEHNLLDVQHSLDVEKQNSNTLHSKISSLQLILSQRQVSQERHDDRSRRNSETSTINDVEPDDSISMVSNISPINTERRTYNSSLYDSLRQQGVAVMLEHLEASLKQKEGQINKLQTEMENLRRSRENVIDEMTQLTLTIERLESTIKVQQQEIASTSDLNDRYNALLQMYGEKMEECEELRMDISEVKEVYRSHIDMLSKSS